MIMALVSGWVPHFEGGLEELGRSQVHERRSMDHTVKTGPAAINQAARTSVAGSETIEG
jgi:hypothetical protein